MSNRIKASFVMMFIAAALIGSVVALSGNYAYAGGSHHHGSSNEAEQEIEQGRWNSQNSQCVSGTFTLASCNNIGFQFQNNLGNLALGQQ